MIESWLCQKLFFCHLQKIHHKNALSTYSWFILSFNNTFDVFFLCIFEVRRFRRNLWKSISQANFFINIELWKSLFAHILCVPCIVFAIWIEFRYESQINPMLLSKSSICPKRIVDDRSYMRYEIVSCCLLNILHFLFRITS